MMFLTTVQPMLQILNNKSQQKIKCNKEICFFVQYCDALQCIE